MALTIATNLFALDTQNALANTSQPLAQAMEQLSTGLKINNASDNAAGLAIATRMQLQINGYAQDVNNANNGVDFAQTAEGAMTGMTQNLQRIYELANQSASYNTSSDRGDMNDEVQQLIAQLNSTVSQTEYNGSTFLNQNFSADFQTGNEVGQTINITTTNVAPNAFGVQSSINDFSNSAANLKAIATATGFGTLASSQAGLAGSATLAGVSLGAAIGQSSIINNSLTIINRINQYTGQTNITAFSFGNSDIGTGVVIASAGTVLGSAGVSIGPGYLTINGISIGSVALGAAETTSAAVADIASTINAITSQTGVTAEVLSGDLSGAGTAYSIALVNTTGAAITVGVNDSQLSAGAAGSITGVAAWGSSGLTDMWGNGGNSIAAGQNGQIVFSSPLNTPTSVVTDNANTANALGESTTTVAMNFSQSLNNVNVSTVGAANLAILAVEQGINTMNNSQAYLGAVVNRFNSAVSELQSDSTNITAARATFMAADYAASTSNLTTAMITEQAGISMLAQANTLPQQILTLLPKV